jgi:hypothetical protein
METIPISFGHCQYLCSGAESPEPVSGLLVCSLNTCPANVDLVPTTSRAPRDGSGVAGAGGVPGPAALLTHGADSRDGPGWAGGGNSSSLAYD